MSKARKPRRPDPSTFTKANGTGTPSDMLPKELPPSGPGPLIPVNDDLSPEQLASLTQLQARLAPQLAELIRSGHFVIVFAHLNGNRVKLWRKTGDFPNKDFDTVLDLLQKDFEEEKAAAISAE